MTCFGSLCEGHLGVFSPNLGVDMGNLAPWPCCCSNMCLLVLTKHTVATFGFELPFDSRGIDSNLKWVTQPFHKTEEKHENGKCLLLSRYLQLGERWPNKLRRWIGFVPSPLPLAGSSPGAEPRPPRAGQDHHQSQHTAQGETREPAFARAPRTQGNEVSKGDLVKTQSQIGEPPVNIRFNPTTKIGSKMGGAPIPKWDLIGFDPRPNRKSRLQSLCDRTVGNMAGNVEKNGWVFVHEASPTPRQNELPPRP